MEILCFIMSVVIDYCICGYLVLILAVMPFYNSEGYRVIGTDKAHFFDSVIKYAGWALLPAVLLYLVFLVISLKGEFWNTVRRKINLTDLFAAGYGLVLIISYLCSNYQVNALWGTTGWFMGFYPQMALVLSYLLVSKLWRPRSWMIYMTFISSGLTALLAYLNRLSIDPLNMSINNSSFISTVGNINWYCGYIVSVLFAGTALLWQGQEMKRWKQILLMLYVFIGFASLLTQGSDSGLLALGVVLFTMFALSAAHSGRMQMFWLEMLLLGGAGLITYLIVLLFPNALNYTEGLGIWLVTHGVFFFVTIMSIIAVAWLHYAVKKRLYPQRVFNILSKAAMAIVLLVIALAVLLIVVNTLWPGSLGALSELSIFTFSASWGSYRGATWIAGWKSFAEQDFWHKLIGVGPDSMSAYLYSDGSEGLRTLMQESFGSQILTNAHNEWLTVLVNTGILGLAAFVGMIVTGIQRFLKEAGRKEIVCACGFCLLAYTVNNMFSFQQSMNVATVFAVFGMGGAFAELSNASVDSKTSSGRRGGFTSKKFKKVKAKRGVGRKR